MDKTTHTNKLRLTFVSDAIYPYNKGGKEKRIYEISTRLAARGHYVTISCMKWWKEDTDSKFENGVHLKAISKYYPLYAGNRRSMKEAIFFALSCFKLVKEDFDVIDVDHMPHLVLFSIRIVTWIKRKKMYASWNEVWGNAYWNTYLGKLGTIAFLIEVLSSRLPDYIISISPNTTNKLKTVLKVQTPIDTIPIGIDVDHIKTIKPSQEKSDIFFAGRLLSNKNIDVLLKSIMLLKEDYPDIKAIIVGDGPEKKKLQALIHTFTLDKNVHLINFLENHDDLYALMKSSKVFVFPSTREGFGIVTLEANACNLPVITTNNKDNAAQDLITDGQNGYIVKLDEKEIADKTMIYLHSKKNKRNYTEFIRKYNWNAIIDRLENVYKE